MKNRESKVQFYSLWGGCLPPCTPLTIRVRKYFVTDLESVTIHYIITIKCEFQLENNLQI